MITFYKKTQAQYDALSTYENDGIYFITDSKVIYLNGVRYGSNLSVVTEWPATGLVGILYVHSSTEEMRIFKDNNWVTVQSPKTSTISISSTDNQIPTAKAVFDYVADAIAASEMGIGGRLHPAVQSIADMKAITTMEDKDMILVEDKGNLYRFDAQSTDAADDDNVVAPTSGSGRWIKMITQITYTGGNGVTIENNIVSLNVNSSIFEFSDGALSIKPDIFNAKMDKITNAVENNVATFNGEGNVKDSGKAIGGAILSATPNANTIATEAAVADALSFK